MMKSHCRFVKFTRPIPKRNPPHTRLLIILWTVLLVGAAVSTLLVIREAQRLQSQYASSPACASNEFTAVPQNCSMEIEVPWMGTYVSFRYLDRGRGSEAFDKMNFVLELPDGQQKTVSTHFDLLDFARIVNMKPGNTAKVEYWQGRITEITIDLPSDLAMLSEKTPATYQTEEHPAEYLANTLERVLYVSAFLLIVIIVFTFWYVLRR